MEQGIRDILKEHYQCMMSTITEPKILASNISVLTPVDLERIEAEARERGPGTGVFELLNRLQKRGPQAFPQLIEALKRTHYPEIANKLEGQAVTRGLHRPIRQTSHDATPGYNIRDIPVVARGPWPSQRPPQAERSLSSPVQPESLSHQESTEEMHGSRSAPELLTSIVIPKPEDLTPYEEARPQQLKNKGRETFLKDIPSNLKDKVVNMLSIDDALGKDWKGIAGELQLTAEEQGQIKSCSKISPMEELFNHMLHKGYRVINLINMLKKIDRQDVIGEISRAGYYSQDLEEGEGVQSPTQVADGSAARNFEKGLPLPKKVSDDFTMEEKKRDAINPAASPLSPTRTEIHSDNSTVKELDEKKEEKEEDKYPTTGLPSPTEVSVFDADNFTKEKTNKKKGSSITGQPSETEDKEAGASSCVKSLPSPTQVSGFSSLDDSSTKPDQKKQAHLSQEIENAKKEEEDENEPLTDMTHFEEVFLPDIIQAKAIFITCEKYQKINKLTHLNQQIKKLCRELEDGNWETIPLKDYTSAKMKSELDLKLHNLSQSDACFVYLAGHTLQINGENYFLPIDVELDLAAADIIDSCLNINSLVKELSERALMALVIVDGGHYNEEKFECKLAMPGLASIIPPSNTVIAFPCQPGYIRPQEEALLYLKALISVIKEKKHLVLTDLFESVREVLKDSQSLPVEFSLSSSLLPMYLNTSEEDEEGITVRKPDDNTPRHAIVFCDHGLELHGDKTTVRTSAGHLKASLKQLDWIVEMCVNLKPEQIKTKIRQSLKGLQDMNVFMLYFIGYVTKDKHSIGQESWEVDAHAQKLPIRWLVDMMSEYVTGPKILIVDYPSVPVRYSDLSPMPALPQEVLCCLPNGNRERSRQEVNSFTLLFAANLAKSGQYSLKTVITTTARKWKYHHVHSKLFYA